MKSQDCQGVEKKVIPSVKGILSGINDTMQRLLSFALVFAAFAGTFGTAYATNTFITQQGGTGTSSPSGILYGDNGGTSHLNTVTIGSNLTFAAGVLSATASSGSFPFAADTNYGVNVYSTSTPTLWFKSGVFASSTNANAGVAIGASSSGRALQITTSGTGPALWLTQSGTNAFLITAIAMTENANAIDIAHNPANPTLATTKTFSLANNNNARGILALFTNNGTNKTLEVDNNDTTDYAFAVTSQGFGQRIIANGASGTSLPFLVQQGGTATSTIFQINSAGLASTTNLTISGLGSGSTQCLQISGAGAVSGTGSGCGTGSSFAFPWTSATNFGVNTNSTTTPIWFKAGFFASSTAPNQVWVDQLSIGSSTSSQLATSTDYGNFIVNGNASTTALVISGLGGTGSNSIAIVRASGVVGTIGLPLAFANGGCGSQSAVTSSLLYYGGIACQAVATSTISFSGPFSGTGFGALVGGNNTTVAWTGLATTTALTANQVLYAANSTTGVTGSNNFVWLNGGGWLGVGTTTPQWLVTLATTTAPQLVLQGAKTDAPWSFRSIGGYLYVATTTNTSAFATTTLAAFSITAGGEVTTQELDVATTTTTTTIDWVNTPNQVRLRIGSAATNLQFINATNSAMLGSRKLVYVCNPPTVSAGATTWVGVEWIGSTPTQTSTSAQCDVLSFDVTQGTSTTATYKIAGSAGAGFQ